MVGCFAAHELHDMLKWRRQPAPPTVHKHELVERLCCFLNA